ncbi:MAG: nucleotide sugar dehydrogenase, partial [Nitrospirae bacterium]|nr:nucleotide sugar dehydrogenase [Nitrospirota bacterium]
MVKKNSYDICIVGGLGHVGLPLGISFAASGERVILYDINKKAIDTVSEGKMPFVEAGAEEVLKKVLGKTLFISSDKNVISDSYFVVIVIGTPVDEHLNPRFSMFEKFMDEMIVLIQDDQHIILRSTV